MRNGGGLTFLSPGATGEGAAQLRGRADGSVTSHEVRTMRIPHLIMVAGTLLASLDVGAAVAAPPSTPSSAAGVEYFEKRVRPILAKACYECHSTKAGKLKAGFALDTRGGMLR